VTDAEDAEATAPAPPKAGPQPQRWWRTPVVLAVAALVAVPAIVVALRFRPDGPAVSATSARRLAPTFAVPDLLDEKATIDLRDFRGQPVLLNFWASWCVPCRKEMPAFEAVHRQLGDEVTFLGVNHQDSRSDAIALLREAGVRYRSGFDPRGAVAEAYSLYGMPTTVFISADGRILATRTGEMSESQLTATIRDLLGIGR
jgi:cytochrome c biogenesis protein CcmG/thiol:disulfide interchange protein DsbE